MRRGGGEPRRLLRLPAESDLALPVIPGTHVVVQGNGDPRRHGRQRRAAPARRRAGRHPRGRQAAGPFADRAATGRARNRRRAADDTRFDHARRQSAGVGRGEGGADRPRRRGRRAGRRERRTGAVAALAVAGGPGRVAAGGAAALAARRCRRSPGTTMAFGPFPTAAHAQPPAAPVPAQPPRADLEITAQPVDLETTDQTDPEQTGEWVGSDPRQPRPQSEIRSSRTRAPPRKSGWITAVPAASRSRSSARVRCRCRRVRPGYRRRSPIRRPKPIPGRKSGEACSPSS